MFESLLESGKRGPAIRPGWISTATVLHGAVLVVIAAAAFLARVEVGADPPPPFPEFKGKIVIARLGDDPNAFGKPHRALKPPEPPRKPEAKPQPPSQPTRIDPLTLPPEPVPPASREGEPPILDSGGPVSGDDPVGDGTGTGKPGIAGVIWGDKEGTAPDGPPTLRGSIDRDDPTAYGVQPPALIVRIEPDYPEVEKRAHIQGTVVLEALVSATGRVETVKVMASPSPGLAAAATRAVQRWRYTPARQSGRAVGFYVRVEVHFVLR